MKNKLIPKLISGNIKKQLIALALPMVIGIFGRSIFNITDAFFISKLGENELAAISFTFPVIIFVSSLAVGIALGTSTVASKLIGEKKINDINELIISSFLLGILVNIVLSIIGLKTIEPLFLKLGASEEILPYIKEYMTIWYSGMFVVIIPQISNNVIRALGDTKTPSMIMMISSFVNLILDPIFMFGLGSFSGMGIKGAALATILSRGIVLFVSIYNLKYKKNLIKSLKISSSKLFMFWKKIIYIGFPTFIVQLLTPLSLAFTTRLLSNYGMATVVSFGIATKIEFFFLTFINSISTILGPFLGQNLGAKKIERMFEAYKISMQYILLYSILVVVLINLFSSSIFRLFTNNVEIINTATLYLKIVSATYIFYGILKIGNTFLIIINKPIISSMLIIFQNFIVYIPLAIVLSKNFNFLGIFVSLSISYFVSSMMALLLVNKEISKLKIITR